MSLEEIEALFERKTEQFHNKLLRLQEEKVVPMTFKLIQRNAVMNEEYLRKLEEAKRYKEEQDKLAESQSETTEQTETQASTNLAEPEDLEEEKKSGDGDEDKESLEDDEAIIISEKKKIEEALRES